MPSALHLVKGATNPVEFKIKLPRGELKRFLITKMVFLMWLRYYDEREKLSRMNTPHATHKNKIDWIFVTSAACFKKIFLKARFHFMNGAA